WRSMRPGSFSFATKTTTVFACFRQMGSILRVSANWVAATGNSLVRKACAWTDRAESSLVTTTAECKCLRSAREAVNAERMAAESNDCTKHHGFVSKN